MDIKLREKAVLLRIKQKLSYGEIMKRLDVPKSTLSNWLCDYPLSEEKILELRRKGWKKGEASRERFRNTMRKKKEDKEHEVYLCQKKRLSNISDDAYFVAGLMLYLGEGNKKSKYNISLANTDPSLIKFFINWTIKYLNVPKKSMRAQLHLYENMDIEKEGKFWQNMLGFNKSQFYKDQIRKLREGSFSYQESYRHGTCSVSFCSGEKKTELMMAIKAYVDLHVLNK